MKNMKMNEYEAVIEAALFCTVCPLELLLAGGHQFLYSLEIRTAYDGRVTVLYKVAGLLAKVSNLPEWNRICGAAFLPDHISGISDIGQDVLMFVSVISFLTSFQQHTLPQSFRNSHYQHQRKRSGKTGQSAILV